MKERLSTKIYRFLQIIPHNRVISYKSLGTRFGIHQRTVANIMRNNKEIETYPCYKVIASDGGLGGYNRGIEEKIRKLKKDGIQIIDGKVNQNYYREPGPSI